jgi:hypothetical protein
VSANAYTLAFGGLLLLAGDILGRRRMNGIVANTEPAPST